MKLMLLLAALACTISVALGFFGIGAVVGSAVRTGARIGTRVVATGSKVGRKVGTKVVNAGSKVSKSRSNLAQRVKTSGSKVGKHSKQTSRKVSTKVGSKAGKVSRLISTGSRKVGKTLGNGIHHGSKKIRYASKVSKTALKSSFHFGKDAATKLGTASKLGIKKGALKSWTAIKALGFSEALDVAGIGFSIAAIVQSVKGNKEGSIDSQESKDAIVRDTYCEPALETNSAMECWFETNFNTYNMSTDIFWEITFNSGTVSEEQQPSVSPCTEFEVIPAADKLSYDILYCFIGNYRYLDSYELLVAKKMKNMNEEIIIKLTEPSKQLSVVVKDHLSGRTSSSGVVQKYGTMSANQYFVGFVARQGDQISLRCDPKQSGDQFLFTNVNSTELVFRTDAKELKNAVDGNTGIYSCGEDSQAITVINTAKAPRIEKYTCILNMAMDLECQFLTNSGHFDLVNWAVSILSSKYQGKCSEIDLIPGDHEEPYDVVVCRLSGLLLSLGSTYRVDVVGRNPFTTGTSHFNTTISSDIARLKVPTVSEVIPYWRSFTMLVEPSDLVDKSTYSASVKGRMAASGVNYLVTVSNGQEYLYSAGPESVKIVVEDLELNTNYVVEVRLQLRTTANNDVWSEASQHSIKTYSNPLSEIVNGYAKLFGSIGSGISRMLNKTSS